MRCNLSCLLVFALSLINNVENTRKSRLNIAIVQQADDRKLTPSFRKTAREAIIWLFEEKLKVDEEDIPKRFSEKLLEKNGLSGMLTRVFNDKVYDALNNEYTKEQVDIFSSYKYSAEQMFLIKKYFIIP